MSGVTSADVDAFGGLKELYDEDSHYQQHIENSLYSFIDKAGADVEMDGKHWNIYAKFALNESYAGLTAEQRLPQSGVNKGVFLQYNVKLNYAMAEGSTFALTRGHAGGRINGKEMDELIKDTYLSFLSNVDYDLYANGNGYRATIETATPAATSFTTVSSIRIRPGMLFDWYDSTYVTKRGSIKIADKGTDRINRTTYVDTTYGSAAVPAGATAGDVLVVLGALDPGTPSDGRFAAGFQRLTDNTLSLGGVSSSTYAWWAATNVNAGGANPSEMLLQQHTDQMYEISGLYPNRMVFNPSWKRAYMEPFLNQRRFTSNTYDTGMSSISYSAVKMGESEKGQKPQMMKMLEDMNADPSEILIFHNQAVQIATDYADTPHLADEDGQEFRMRLGYDALQGFYRFWWNTIVPQRNALGRQYNYAAMSGVI